MNGETDGTWETQVALSVASGVGQCISLEEHQEIVDDLLEKYKAVAAELKNQIIIRKNTLKGEFEPPNDRPSSTVSDPTDFRVLTYNIWNVNEPWGVRAHCIKEIVTLEDVDVIGFQEVRWYKGKNQLDMMAELMPRYKYKLYVPTDDKMKDGEGLGLLSIHPIISSTTKLILQHPTSTDTNNRIILQASINIPPSSKPPPKTNLPLHIFLTHLSYDDKQQCYSSIQLLDYMNQFRQATPNAIQILLGDMNTYFDFEWPMDFLTKPLNHFTTDERNPCSSYFREFINEKELDWIDLHNQDLLNDAWEVHTRRHPELSFKGGYTFTNFNDDRLMDPTRSDRILYRVPLKDRHTADSVVSQVRLVGGEPVSYCPDTLETEGPCRVKPSKTYISDHKGVLVSFTLPTSSSASSVIES